MAKATFGAGCFWGVKSFSREVPGVLDAACDYMGERTQTPTYRQIRAGHTNYVMDRSFDQQKIPYGKLVALFFKIHDWTQLNVRDLVSARNTAPPSSATLPNRHASPTRRSRRCRPRAKSSSPSRRRRKMLRPSGVPRNITSAISRRYSVPTCHVNFEELAP